MPERSRFSISNNNGYPQGRRLPAPCFQTDGVHFHLPVAGNVDSSTRPLQRHEHGELTALLAQLEEEGYAVAVGREEVVIEWPVVFDLLEGDTPYTDSLPLLSLPPRRDIIPALGSNGTLADGAGFSISITGWWQRGGSHFADRLELAGAVVARGEDVLLLPEPCWRLVDALRRFYARPPEERTVDTNRRDWAHIRSHAVRAGADLGDFLRRTVILTPERLRLEMRKADIDNDTVVEIIPGFDDAPTQFLEFFDRFPSVPDNGRYDIPVGDGMVQVLLEPEVKTVLQEIKRMPGRRVAGTRAENFIRNPYAMLGETARAVLDEDEFLGARRRAGINPLRFTVHIGPVADGMSIRLRFEDCDTNTQPTEYLFPDPESLECFCTHLAGAISEARPWCTWQGQLLEIEGDTPGQLLLLRRALTDWRRQPFVSYEEVFDLSGYSPRIEGIGEDRSYISPFIARQGVGGWVPDNVDGGVIVRLGDDEKHIQLSAEEMQDLRGKIAVAEQAGAPTISIPGCVQPVPLAMAKKVLDDLAAAWEDVKQGEFRPEAKKSLPRLAPILKPNIDTIDYRENRDLLRPAQNWNPSLPASLKPDAHLKPHQIEGYGWLLHLWTLSPERCRGALLADDMGLGKTLQVLVLIARCLETDANLLPVLIVAPVTLLDNWQEEIARFFRHGTLPVQRLYGDALAARRLGQERIDPALYEQGITRLLEPGWQEDARIVLTTYETLRDFEFSFARERWSLMVCDEAQKIKNPDALMTRAAKKQHVRFRIACTGTPVENSLTDIWSIFDFLQPGLLEPLNQFGRLYRRPIEAQTAEEEGALERLKAQLAPQILRRTKAEVARDLPNKVEHLDCCHQLSAFQCRLYAQAVGFYRQRQHVEGNRAGILGLLKELRLICTAPRPIGERADAPVPLAEYRQRSPKLTWLLATLREIERMEEKTLLFVEYREVQRLLQGYIQEEFGIRPAIVNGSTPTSGANTRRRSIDEFQQRPGFNVIILSPLAVGVGLNIQAANHVIHFTRAWNPAKEDQATDRAYRIGQTREVHVYYPRAVSDAFVTFDARLHDLLSRKRELARNFLNGSDDLTADDFGDVTDVPDSVFPDDGLCICIADIDRLTADAFECFCAVLWSKMGYDRVVRTPQSGDGGIDVVAIREIDGVLIQCKTTQAEDGRIGREGIGDVVAGAPLYAQRYPGISFRKAVATNRSFNRLAQMQARLLQVELIDRQLLVTLLQQYTITKCELEEFAFRQ